MGRIASFENTWLDMRFPFDARARHKGIEALFLKQIPTKDKVRLADLGAGIGGSCRYFIDKIAANQQWLLVEKDPTLFQSSLTYLAQYGRSENWAVKLDADRLFLKKGKKEIEVSIFCGDMLDWLKMEEAKSVDALTSNAIYDLFSRDQIERLAQAIVYLNVPLLTTLNYAGMAMFPHENQDDKFIQLYEKHMQRPQHFGRGVGKDGGLVLQEIFQALGKSTLAAESMWKIGPRDKAMQQRLLAFMEEAIPELSLAEEDLQDFNDWLIKRRSLVGSSDSSMQVFHLDVLIY